MANLEPMPISSLPEGDIQDGDKAIIYRESTGKAYQTTGLAQLNADLTDLGGRLYETTMTQNGTYRVIFTNSIATNSNSVIAFIFARSENGRTHLSLFVNGYGYGSARSAVFEMTKGSNISYEVDESVFAIDITVNSSGLTRGYIQVFMLHGTLADIEFTAS